MTGFRLPAEAVEAALRAAYDFAPQWIGSGEDRRPKTYEECYGVHPMNHEDDVGEMVAALSAALPVLAKSPELASKLGRYIFERAWPGARWNNTDAAVQEVWQHEATNVLRDLFAASPTDTTEENTDG